MKHKIDSDEELSENDKRWEELMNKLRQDEDKEKSETESGGTEEQEHQFKWQEYKEKHSEKEFHKEERINPTAVLNYLGKKFSEVQRISKMDYRLNVVAHSALTLVTFGGWIIALACYWVYKELKQASEEEKQEMIDEKVVFE